MVTVHIESILIFRFTRHRHAPGMAPRARSGVAGGAGCGPLTPVVSRVTRHDDSALVRAAWAPVQLHTYTTDDTLSLTPESVLVIQA
jgi:hypothetical protein